MNVPGSKCAVWWSMALLGVLASGCGKVSGSNAADAAPGDGIASDDAGVDAAPVDGPPTDAPGGSQNTPANTCAELHTAGTPSGVYWLRDPLTPGAVFQAYCEQQLNGGGWVMMENSVRRADGTTAAFWQFKKADALKEIGTLAVDQNYYYGALYQAGREYMDVITDLNGKTAIAAVMTATGFNPDTMLFTGPALTVGNVDVFTSQFASDWASQDFHAGTADTTNCAVKYSNIAQHYGSCFAYSLGADDLQGGIDGGVGPHVSSSVLTALVLGLQTGGGTYSQVKRIARFTRW